MDKIAMYKEEIYKEAGLGDAFKRFKENAKDAFSGTSWDVNRNNKKTMNDFASARERAYQRARQNSQQQSSSGSRSSNSAGADFRAGETNTPLHEKYGLNDITTKADFNKAKRKAIFETHPDRHVASFGGDATKMTEQTEKFKNLMKDFESIEKSPWFSKLAYYLQNGDIEKIASTILEYESF